MTEKPDIARILGEAAMKAVDPKLHAAQMAEAAEARKAVIEITSANFDRASAYTNVIIVAGYAGMFSIWAFTSEHLTKHATALVAILLGFSLVTFILYEVYKMVFIARQMVPRAHLLREPMQSAAFLAELRKLQLEEQRVSITWLMRVWAVVMVLAVGSAFLATGLLFYNLFAVLLDGPIWPA